MRLKTYIFSILFSVLLINTVEAQTFTVDTLVNNGNKYNRINLVFMGDGYTASQQAKFSKDVNVIVNKLFQTFPFSQYRAFFNVYAIHVISTDSGTKHPVTAADCSTTSPSVPASSPNTYLNSTFDYGGIHRLLYCPNTSAVNELLQDNFPLYDKGMIVVNTPYFGGSGGIFPTCSTNPYSAEIMIHELGHSFAGLGDEYGGTLCANEVEKPNCTQETNPALIKWKAWIPAGEPIPTASNTLCNTIGLYQGANYCNSSWYRPKCNCKMNVLGNPFCEVCSESFIYSINNSVSLIDSYQPAQSSIAISTGQSQNFSTTLLLPSPNSLNTTWKLDNVVVASNIYNYTVQSTLLTAGAHILVFSVTDTTAHSKIFMPVYTKTWMINNTVLGNVMLNPFSPVYLSAPAFPLTNGFPAGGIYTGAGVLNGKFTPAETGIGVFEITYTISGISATQSITVNAVHNNSTGISNAEAGDAAVNIYPNPSNGLFTVRTAAINKSNAQVIITDMFGKEVLRKSYNAEESESGKAMDISGLPAGTYFVQVKKGAEVISKKITKN